MRCKYGPWFLFRTLLSGHSLLVLQMSMAQTVHEGRTLLRPTSHLELMHLPANGHVSVQMTCILNE